MPDSGIVFFWHRRDLRTFDNKGLIAALKYAAETGAKVQPVFIFDENILANLPKDDARVSFIYDSLLRLDKNYQSMGSNLLILNGRPENVWTKVLNQYEVKAVFANEDYEPYARQRDGQITDVLKNKGIAFKLSKDHVIFSPDEVVKEDNTPYLVYTPYSKVWRKKFQSESVNVQSMDEYTDFLVPVINKVIPMLQNIGFRYSPLMYEVFDSTETIIKQYEHTRNLPANERSTTRLGVSLRFGTISIRELALQAARLSEAFLNELIWREFFQMILYHFPHSVNSSIKPAYDNIEWRHDEEGFAAWCEGRTGYPIVDAGMRELNTTGFMHNRVRMITASFLTKHLLIDWRWGERYFAGKLMDFELASNVGGWQWAAGSGCDAAPYFRIFNPYIQTEKFDPGFGYVRKWVPEFSSSDYPGPIVEHTFARDRALEVYKKGLSVLA
jgi:deoxyribodipyrimidine photo-lyase